MSDDKKTLTREALRRMSRELETCDRDRQSGEGEYSVIKFFAEHPGTHYAHRWVTWEEAQEAAQHYTSSPGAQQGALRRVIITDGDDRTVFEWKHGEGVVVGKAIDPEEVRRLREGREAGPPKPNLCSFCGKSQHEVRKLVAGPSVFICNECVVQIAQMMGIGAKG